MVVCDKVREYKTVGLITLTFNIVQDGIILTALYPFWQDAWTKIVNAGAMCHKAKTWREKGREKTQQQQQKATIWCHCSPLAVNFCYCGSVRGKIVFVQHSIFPSYSIWLLHIDGLIFLIQKGNGAIGANSKTEVFQEEGSVSRCKPYTHSADQRKGQKVALHLNMAKQTDRGGLLIIHGGMKIQLPLISVVWVLGVIKYLNNWLGEVVE